MDMLEEAANKKLDTHAHTHKRSLSSAGCTLAIVPVYSLCPNASMLAEIPTEGRGEQTKKGGFHDEYNNGLRKVRKAWMRYSEKTFNTPPYPQEREITFLLGLTERQAIDEKLR